MFVGWLIWSAGRGRQIRMKVGHVGCLDNCSKGEPFGSFSCWSGRNYSGRTELPLLYLQLS
jgi:hypothetical protein